MNSDNSMAICIPTYNRPDLVRDTLQFELPSLIKWNIDVYIYDSSSNNLTENIIKEFQNDGFDNLYYIKLSVDILLETKVIKIFSFYGMKQSYEYLWLTNDVFGISDLLLKDLNTILSKKYDIILVNNKDVEQIGIREYKNANDFFDDCAWRSTLFGAVILHNNIFKYADWNSLKTKYGGKEFLYIAFYFESIIKQKNFRALHIGTQNGIRYSNLKQGSWWKSQIFYVWCDCWQETIYKLPDYYINKDLTIKKLGVLSELFSRNNMISLRMNGLFNIKIYRSYITKILKLSDLSQVELLIIALIPRWICRVIRYSKKVKRVIKSRMTTSLFAKISGTK